MTLKEMGFNSDFYKEFSQNITNIGRVICAFKNLYTVQTEKKNYTSQLTGNISNTIRDSNDLPIAGDWVELENIEDDNPRITKILPRKTILERKKIGRSVSNQIIAVNIDFAFIVMGADRDFSINRMERFLAIINEAGIIPVLILNKTDLCSKKLLNSYLQDLKMRHPDVKVIQSVALDRKGISGIKNELLPGKTFCLIGSSGAGKSTIINTILKKEVQLTQELSIQTQKGTHATTNKHLFFTDKGSILIDTPGLREIGVLTSDSAINDTFNDITQLALNCKFSNCTHTNEPGCTIIAAIENGDLNREKFDSYTRLKKETEFFSMDSYEKRKKDKEFGKMVKKVKSYKKKKGGY